MGDVDPAAAPGQPGTPSRLLVLGPPALLRGGTVRPPGTQKALALASYLGIRGEPASREQLATLLWPDSASDQARRSLRGELGRLRAVFSGDAIDSSRLAIWLDRSMVDVDVVRFHDLLAQGHDEQAALLYRGPLLEGLDLRNAEPFEEWLHGERHLIEIAHLGALRRLIRANRDRGDAAGVLRWAWRAVRCQPLAEDFYLDAMEAAEELDDRASVLAIFARLGDVLRAELGIEPRAEAKALAERAAGTAPGGQHRAASTPPRQTASSMVGHEKEQAVLQDAVRRAADGAGSLAFVHGPAGSGKTRLLHTVTGGRRVVWCPAQRSVSTVAYYPIAAGLRQYLSRWGVPSADELWLREAARVCPELSRAAPNPSLGAPEDKVRLLEGLAVTLAGAAGRGGAVVFDDVQWADPDTFAVLEDLVRRLPQLGIVIAIVVRDDHDLTGNAIADVIATAARFGCFVDVAVEELSREHLQDLVGTAYSTRFPHVPRQWLDEFAGMVHDVLGGNPFYALECARLALDSSGEPAIEPLAAVKFGVRDVVRTRLAGLPAPLRQSAEAAAVAGGPVDADVLARMLDIGPWELADRLDALVEKGIVTCARGGLTFVHDLVADVVYESLPPARRQLLHERAALALTQAAALDLDAVSGQIAAHLEAAGQEQKAVPYHERAAEAARRAHAHQTAIHHYQRLRALVPADRQVPLLLRLGELLSYGAAGEAETLYHEALRLAEVQGDGHAQARCYVALGVLLQRRSDLTGSRRALTEALRRFQVYGDNEGLEHTLEALTYAHIQQGELTAAASSANQAAALARDTGRLTNLGRATLSRGIAHLYGGEPERALRCFESARGIAVDTADELAEAEALRYLSGAYGLDGRCGTPAQAWAAAEKSIEICVRLGHRIGLSRAADGAGGAYLLHSDWQRALDCYVAALHLTDSVGYVWGSDAMVYRVGYTLLQAGENTRAARALAHAEKLSRKLNAPYWLCRTLLAASELALRDDDRVHAAGQAQAALDLAEHIQHRDFRSKAALLLGRAALSSDDGPAADSRTRPLSPIMTAGRPAVPGIDAELPAVPPALEVPVHGVAAVTEWLDEVVERQLSAFSDCDRRPRS